MAIETTGDEIVDVRERDGRSGSATRDAAATCVVEAAWGMRLDPAVFRAGHDHYGVAAGGR